MRRSACFQAERNPAEAGFISWWRKVGRSAAVLVAAALPQILLTGHERFFRSAG